MQHARPDSTPLYKLTNIKKTNSSLSQQKEKDQKSSHTAVPHLKSPLVEFSHSHCYSISVEVFRNRGYFTKPRLNPWYWPQCLRGILVIKEVIQAVKPSRKTREWHMCTSKTKIEYFFPDLGTVPRCSPSRGITISVSRSTSNPKFDESQPAWDKVDGTQRVARRAERATCWFYKRIMTRSPLRNVPARATHTIGSVSFSAFPG